MITHLIICKNIFKNRFNDVLKSLILYYPLTIDYMDLNVMKNYIGVKKLSAFDDMNYYDIYKPTTATLTIPYQPYDIYNPDNIQLNNWSYNFDWNIANSGKYITNLTGLTVSSGICNVACTKCYSNASTDCYACATGFTLRSKRCIPVTNYYFKTPVTLASSSVNIKITDITAGYDITSNESLTITFWMKFIGVVLSSASTQPIIASLNANTFFAYDVTSHNLLFNQNNQLAFEDTQFTNSIGTWILITFSNYISGTKGAYFPNMVQISINKRDIPMKSTYTIPSSGIIISQFQFGYECVALFSELRFYKKFIQGAYGWLLR